MLKALPQPQSLCPHYFTQWHFSEGFLTSHMNTGIQRAAFFALKHQRNFNFLISCIPNNFLGSVRLFRQPEVNLCRKIKGKWSLIIWQQQRTQLEAPQLLKVRYFRWEGKILGLIHLVLLLILKTNRHFGKDFSQLSYPTLPSHTAKFWGRCPFRSKVRNMKLLQQLQALSLLHALEERTWDPQSCTRIKSSFIINCSGL